MNYQRQSVKGTGGEVFRSNDGARAMAARLWLRAPVVGDWRVYSSPAEHHPHLETVLTTILAAAAGSVQPYTIDGPAGFLRVTFTPAVSASVECEVALEVSTC